MNRLICVAYGTASYILFFGVYAWFCAFVGNLWLDKTIDAPVTSAPATAAATNLGLLAIFALQHSIMARPAFKRVWTRLVPQPLERSTYVLISSLALGLLLWQWRPMDALVWNVENPLGRVVLWGLFAVGWLMVPGVSMMINHFDLFGMRQVWLHWRGREYQPLAFRTPMLYAHIRHPLYVGWAIAFWATPVMSAGHLLLAAALTAYMMAAALVEERDLIAHFGEDYLRYRQTVPRYLPRLWQRRVAPPNLAPSDSPAEAVRT